MSKLKKSDVKYGPATDAASTCGGCTRYLGGACEVVEGQISPAYWCEYHQHMPDLQEESRRYGR